MWACGRHSEVVVSPGLTVFQIKVLTYNTVLIFITDFARDDGGDRLRLRRDRLAGGVETWRHDHHPSPRASWIGHGKSRGEFYKITIQILSLRN